MPQTYLVFDFGANEEAAQQARHRLDAWKQGFRLGNKVQFKFERMDSDSAQASEDAGKGKKKEKEAESKGRVRLLVRLDFSNHEKHLFQQWLQRIPAEEPFKSAKPEAVHHGAPSFEITSELFDNLN
jgi:hypothetical protein